MPISALKEDFIAAGNGELHLSAIGGGCRMKYVTGPNGKPEWQHLSFWGGHGPSNKRFVVNAPVMAGDALYNNFLDGHVHVRTDPVPPMGNLEEAARAAARAVLEAMKA